MGEAQIYMGDLAWRRSECEDWMRCMQVESDEELELVYLL